ncbi:hypothetical protein E2542_SST13761 [Spatholobus suberectus]|nr:hypothetical protein E2542_SST13761 [Spatholobus suberectus]
MGYFGLKRCGGDSFGIARASFHGFWRYMLHLGVGFVAIAWHHGRWRHRLHDQPSYALVTTLKCITCPANSIGLLFGLQCVYSLDSDVYIFSWFGSFFGHILCF